MTGNVKNGFTAEFVPIEVGIHMILVEYNGVAVGGTPYYSKAYDSESVGVSDIPKSAAGKTVTFAGKSPQYYIKQKHIGSNCSKIVYFLNIWKTNQHLWTFLDFWPDVHILFKITKL